MTVTSAPIGTTGQSLDGFAVNANVADAFRESVVITGPNVSTEIVVPTSTQPIVEYGLPVWLMGASPALAGTTQVYGGVSSYPVGVASTVVVSSVPHALVGTSQVFGGVSSFPLGVASTFAVNNPGTVSTQIISSIPFFVAQSSAPWSIIGGVQVTNTVVVSSLPSALVGTSQVFGIVSTQVISSIPFFVAQSSAPWTFNGGINVSSQSAVSSSFPIGTTSTQVVSSIPYFVAQSTFPWIMSPTASSGGGGNPTTMVCGANLNTTVIKAGKGQVYSVSISYFGSSNAYVKLCNVSTAAPSSSSPTMLLFGLQSSTTVFHSFPLGTEFATGITMYTVRTPFDNARGTTGILSSSMTVTICYE